MQNKDKVIDALSGGPLTIEQIVEKTGIKLGVLYHVTGDLATRGIIDRKNVDGGRGRIYELCAPRAVKEGTTLLMPTVTDLKKSEKSEKLPQFKVGDKFLIHRESTTICVLVTTAGTFNLASGKAEALKPDEIAFAKPLGKLRGEVMQVVEF